MDITKEIVGIKPKTNYLSSTELCQNRNVEYVFSSNGLKRAMPENTEVEQQELEKLYEKLQLQLSLPRIERMSGRSVAEWDSIAEAVRVLRKDGKFETFGYNVNGNYYLEFYEALFLLEVNRLQLEYNSRILSIEQAYSLLLGEEESSKYNEYLVFSHLTRVGYILVKHQNIHFQKHQIENAEDCIWAVLDAELEGEKAPDYVRKSKYYAKTQKQYEEIKNNIINQKQVAEQKDEEKLEDFLINENKLYFAQKIKPSLKRKCEDTRNNWHKAKRRRNYTTHYCQRSLIDFLKDEDEYKKFQKQFESFDIVPLKIYEETYDDDNEDNVEQRLLHISFDVYMHNEGFRKSSPHMPNFRIIILKPAENFPTHKEIFFTYRNQLNPVPLLLVTVNASKQIQAFLYFVS